MTLLAVSTQEVIEAILGSIDEAIHAVDENGITIFYNTVAAKHDGSKIENVLGKHLLEAFPSLSRETSTLMKVLNTKKPILHQVQRYQNLNGEDVCTVNTTLPIFIEGEIAGAVEIAKDYSTIQKLTDTIVDLQSKMKRSSRKKITKKHVAFNTIVTNDSRFKQTKDLAQKVAPTNANVLIYGETGTGKELFVQAIHEASNRKNKPFIAQNCAALPESLLESLLFGTTKGSYTGAIERAGLFELADGGTLFLDELNSMPLDLQAKMLRALEDGVIRRIGDSKTRKVDVRVITAMNQPPEVCLRENKIRTDLYYRLNVFSLYIPPLRERKEDVLLLASYFLRDYNKEYKKQVLHIDNGTKERLLAYHWPGNVRELKHTIEHAVIIAEGGSLTVSCLPRTFRKEVDSKKQEKSILPLREALHQTEKELINQALMETDGNILQAAKLLGIPRQTLQYKLNKYDKTAE
ncbi:sigma-54 interaction domain-containing protein [Bacillus pseudomycoides]|uniref:sigma-54 interaction domain-containing protein n=1 Tax=Bacillus pseudomycoides TaxID=64104 RepID=UPI000BED31FF|nr:sigma 54-interacting transcriptional regulator [Bacillus pseudomycoides]PEE40795.1 sigma-54-dependent Fis family transcriptional regulator [Bacillus pseudomycoides]PEI90828.1 sigma-54-dependent Fis family transcriptional regulator [Bacillus pseudomycoides]PGA81787.1 sigma-54-dependent Fis family transcriptional regulator [Bacillus pseudomycoides]PHF35723.1 sigma-54-dependent Fis family transcriptional regulator [Bacillus pseudomycoides]